MSTSAEPLGPTKGLRLAHEAWQVVHQDPSRSIELARQGLLAALEAADDVGAAWARLSMGYHQLYQGTPQDAVPDLTAAKQSFEALNERAGYILASAGLARCLWREGQFSASLEHVLALREEGLRVLRHEQRSILLNIIAGCYSAQGQSERAFAYMYQALRHSRPTHGRGLDAVLYCNLAHELLQIGDCHEALRYIDLGIRGELKSARLLGLLLVNRIICLTELGRATEAMTDVLRVRSMPAGPDGIGQVTYFSCMAIASVRAGEYEIGRDVVTQTRASPRQCSPDEQFEFQIAAALLAGHEGRWDVALAELDHVLLGAGANELDTAIGLSLRVRCMYFQTRSEVHERLGDSMQALAHMRIAQRLQLARAHLASQARYQAAALQTELLRLQHKQESSERAMSRFFAAASHDLRQPLHALAINATTLQLMAARSTDLALKQVSESINSALAHSDQLLDSLLDVARLDAQPPQPKSAALRTGTLIRDLHAEFSSLAQQQGIDFYCLEGNNPAVESDGEILVRIFRNLLSNALKFTPRGGRVEIESRDVGDEVLLLVRDSGPGIPPAMRERIFEEFFQLDNPARDRSKGLGLGLAIVKRLAAALDVQVQVDSVPGHNTCFSLRLARINTADADQESGCAPANQPAGESIPWDQIGSLREQRLLVVDDDPDALSAMHSLFTELGAAVRSASNLASTLQAIDEGFLPTVVVVDLFLRDEDGLEVLSLVRSRIGNLPALLLTGEIADRSWREVIDDRTLLERKPLNGRRLGAAIMRIVGKA